MSFLSLFRLTLLAVIIAAALIAVLWVTDVIPDAQVGAIVLRTFAVIGIVFTAAFAWNAVRKREHVPDHTDQPVP